MKDLYDFEVLRLNKVTEKAKWVKVLNTAVRLILPWIIVYR